MAAIAWQKPAMQAQEMTPRGGRGAQQARAQQQACALHHVQINQKQLGREAKGTDILS